MTRTLAASAAVAAAALITAAHAQVTLDSSVTFSLAWQEADPTGIPGGNNNGALDPGEWALLRLTISFTNQYTLGSFSPPVGSFSSGTIRGLASGFIDLNGVNSAQGSWNVDSALGLGCAEGWNGPNVFSGTAAAGGARLVNVEPYQSPGSPPATIVANPIVDIWTGLWIPASFAPRVVRFDSAPGSASGGFAGSVIFATSATTLASAFVSPNLITPASVEIPIAPAPASILVLAIWAAAARRHREGQP